MNDTIYFTFVQADLFISYVMLRYSNSTNLLVSCSDEGSLDSPSDHPPMSPKIAQSPDELTPQTTQQNVPVDKQNGEKPQLHISSNTNIKFRRYLKFILAVAYFYTKPLIEIP